MNALVLWLSAISAAAAVASAAVGAFAALLTFLCRRDDVRDATRPYRLAAFDNRAVFTMLFLNTRPSGVVILAADLDVNGDGKTVVPDAFVFDEVHLTPQCVPGWAYVRFFFREGADHGVPVNVNSRVVFLLSNGERPKSPVGFLAKVADLAAARKPKGAVQPSVVVCAE